MAPWSTQPQAGIRKPNYGVTAVGRTLSDLRETSRAWRARQEHSVLISKLQTESILIWKNVSWYQHRSEHSSVAGQARKDTFRDAHRYARPRHSPWAADQTMHVTSSIDSFVTRSLAVVVVVYFVGKDTAEFRDRSFVAAETKTPFLKSCHVRRTGLDRFRRVSPLSWPCPSIFDQLNLTSRNITKLPF